MKTITAKLDEGGRVVIPATCRKALGVKPGDRVVLVMEEEGLLLITLEQAIKRAQRILNLPVQRSLVDELIEERREEAARD